VLFDRYSKHTQLGGYDLCMGVHSIYVREGSRGSAQKKPRFCIAANSFLECICNVMQSFRPFSTSRHISDLGESRSLSKVYLLLGLFAMKAFS